MPEIINGVTCYTWRESFDMCQHRVCKYHAIDLEDAYCTHPESFRVSPVFGCSTNRMIREGLCTGCNDKPEKNLRQLFAPAEKK
jgi:hypothetical protein